MPGFSYTYDLTRPELGIHPLSSGVTHIQRFASDLQKCRDNPQSVDVFKGRLAELEPEKPIKKKVEPPPEPLSMREQLTKRLKRTKEPVKKVELEPPPKPRKPLSLAEQAEVSYLKELIEYVEHPERIGNQLAKDIQRDSHLKDVDVPQGDTPAAKKAAKAFITDLSLAQQVLVNQSQGLSVPTLNFLSQNLRLPGQAETSKISAQTLKVSSVTFSKDQGILDVERLDHCYTFDTSTQEESGLFFYKIAGGEIKSGSRDKEDEDELYLAIQKAVLTAEQPLDPSHKIKVKHPEGKAFDFEIEPIVSVQNTITMGPNDKSPNWKVTVTTHDDAVKLDKEFNEAAVAAKKPEAEGILATEIGVEAQRRAEAEQIPLPLVAPIVEEPTEQVSAAPVVEQPAVVMSPQAEKPTTEGMGIMDVIGKGIVSVLVGIGLGALAALACGVIGLLIAGPPGFVIGGILGASIGTAVGIPGVWWTLSAHDKPVEIPVVPKSSSESRVVEKPEAVARHPAQESEPRRDITYQLKESRKHFQTSKEETGTQEQPRRKPPEPGSH